MVPSGAQGGTCMWLQRWGFIAGPVAWMAGLALAALLGWQTQAGLMLILGGGLLAGAVALLVTLGKRNAGTTGEIALVALFLLALLVLGMARLASGNPAS